MTSNIDPDPDEWEEFDKFCEAVKRDTPKLCRWAREQMKANPGMIGHETCGPGEHIWLWTGGDVASVHQEMYDGLSTLREQGCFRFILD